MFLPQNIIYFCKSSCEPAACETKSRVDKCDIITIIFILELMLQRASHNAGNLNHEKYLLPEHSEV